MIDGFKKIAQALQFLRLPSVLSGLVCLVALAAIVLGSKSHAEDYYLIPSLVGLLWSVTTYAFLVNFHSVPQRADPSWKFLRRLRRSIVRAGYWLLGVVFVGITLGALFVSYRIIVIWLRDYGS